MNRVRWGIEGVVMGGRWRRLCLIGGSVRRIVGLVLVRVRRVLWLIQWRRCTVTRGGGVVKRPFNVVIWLLIAVGPRVKWVTVVVIAMLALICL